jgi:hypothetical protein
VQVPVKRKPLSDPVTIEPTAERKRFEIEIPRTGAGLRRVYMKIEGFDPKKADPVFDASDLTSLTKLRVEIEDAMNRVKLGEEDVEVPAPPLGNDVVAAITNRVQQAAGLTMEFAELLPVVKTYLRTRAFGETVDLDALEVREFLKDFIHQDKVSSYLARQLGELTTEEMALNVQPEPLRLSKTPPFLWRRQKLDCAKTIFNHVAVFNPFEAAFAGFLDRVPDVVRFAALAETFTGFWVDYLKPSGAIGRYFPDWVVVQKTKQGRVNWIVETKGRVWPGTEAKDAAVERWCQEVSKPTGQPWDYIRVNQIDYNQHAGSVKTFGELIQGLREPPKPELALVQGGRAGERLETERDRLPLFSLDAAVRYFGRGQRAEDLEHIEVDFPVEQGMFAAVVETEAMAPEIPGGSMVLFREFEGGPHEGKIGLVSSDAFVDPGTGEHHTVRRLRSEVTRDAAGRVTRISVRLEPSNASFEQIEFEVSDPADVQVLALVEEVLPQPTEIRAAEPSPA